MIDLLDEHFYDNDGGIVNYLSFSDNFLIVTYQKSAGNEYACIVRDIDDELIGKIKSLKITMQGEINVDYLIKLEGGKSNQYLNIKGTGSDESYLIIIDDYALMFNKIVIFASPGISGTHASPLCGTYKIKVLEVITDEPKKINNGKKRLHLLAIGNSFSDDGLWLSYQLFKDLGYDDIIIANLYIGGCSLSLHKYNIDNDASAYIYRTNNNGYWQNVENYKISDALKHECWDYISLQQASKYSGLKEENKKALIDAIYDYVYNLASIKNPNVKFLWHMTWAYEATSNHPAFQYYNYNQLTMYKGIVDVVKNIICQSKYKPIIVPGGTTIQNLRTSSIGDHLTRDGFHLNFDYGRYSAALTFVYMLTKANLQNVSAPLNIDQRIVALCKSAAVKACINPFKITNMNNE